MVQSYDVIVVGAGSSGCAVTGRLVAAGVEVLLLEAGPDDAPESVRQPWRWPHLWRTPLDWAYNTTSQAGLGGRRDFWPRGKVIGGSSALNSMIYMRGAAETYDAWAQAGCPGWSYTDLLPLFRRSEDNARGSSEYHGVGGPIRVADHLHPSALSHAVVEAGLAVGFDENPDFNGATQHGFGFYQVTQHEGRRWSASNAYLDPIRSNPNLTIGSGAHALGLVIEGDRCIGVRYRATDGVHTALASETILAAGAVNTPQLLMLSGIGPADHLNAVGLLPRVDLPGVGANLRDHVRAFVTATCRSPMHTPGVTVDAHGRESDSRRLTSNQVEAGGFVQVRSGAASDLQFHFRLVWHGDGRDGVHGLAAAPTVVAPRSVGSIRLRSNDPDDPPVIDPNYFADPIDLAIMEHGVELGHEILCRPPVSAMLTQPAVDVTSRAEIRNLIVGTSGTLFHPVGTARMGRDEMAVVDPELKVRGVDGLRVADASVMPTIINANTHATCVVIGEKCADLILDDLRAADVVAS